MEEEENPPEPLTIYILNTTKLRLCRLKETHAILDEISDRTLEEVKDRVAEASPRHTKFLRKFLRKFDTLKGAADARKMLLQEYWKLHKRLYDDPDYYKTDDAYEDAKKRRRLIPCILNYLACERDRLGEIELFEFYDTFGTLEGWDEEWYKIVGRKGW